MDWGITKWSNDQLYLFDKTINRLDIQDEKTQYGIPEINDLLWLPSNMIWLLMAELRKNTVGELEVSL